MKKLLMFFVATLAFVLVSCSSSSTVVKVRQYIVSGDPATTPDAQNFDLFIIHTNDVAGYVNEENKDIQIMNASNFAGFVDDVRKYNANTLVLDAGNFTFGTRLAASNSGSGMINLAKLIGYNAMTVGDQDMNYGYDTLVRNIESARNYDPLRNDDIYYVSQNLTRGGNNITDKFKIFNVNGYKVAVIGLTTPNARFELAPSALRSMSLAIDYRALQKDINSLRRKVNYIILLSNIGNMQKMDGYLNIEEVMKKIKNVDIVIDGYSKDATQEPLIVKDLENKDIMVLQTGSNLHNVGFIQIPIIEGRSQTPVFNLISAAEFKNPESSAVMKQLNIIERYDLPEVKDFIDKLQESVDQVYGEPLSFMPFPLSGAVTESRTTPTDLGYVIAESFVNNVESDIAIFPSILIKNGIAAGDITREDVYKAFPCDANIIRVPMTGAMIWNVLEYGYSMLPQPAGRYPQTNLIIESNPIAEVGSRIISITMQDGTVVENSNAETFTVAILDSMIQGLEGYNQFSNANSYPGGVAWEAFAEQLAEAYPVN